ncbi:XRE family transcriptional regulator [Promicromonospora sp. NPDC057138]|uniref:XRE family transcriptional regulator n=1 Tax=Promicromonospora sp. NPDC057138 TaxID=3346031 RepID=UPI0036385E36
MRNQRLVAAMSQAGLSQVRLAAAVGVDPKTVERWVAQGRTPHPRHRVAVSDALGCDVAALWGDVDRAEAAAQEIVGVYPARRAVPSGTWRAFVAGVEQRFELHAFAATFLPDQTLDLTAEIVNMAARGVQVRLLLGDPDGAAVAVRTKEEGGTGLSGRIALVLAYLAPALGTPGVEVRLHDSTLYATTFRFDDDLLVNTHVWGSPAGANPLLHLKDGPEASMAPAYQAGFERVWGAAKPLAAWPRTEDSDRVA